MTERTDQGGAALILVIIALLLVPAAYVFAHPHWRPHRAAAAASADAAANGLTPAG